jgi:hypothetical protein
MNFLNKLFGKPAPTSSKKRSHGGKSRSRSRSRSRSSSRYVGGSSLSPADFSAGSDSSAAEYMLKTVGDVSTQLNNAGDTNTIHSLKGGRHKGGRHRKSHKGGFMGEVLSQGVVPAALVGMSLYKGSRLQSGKSYRSSRSRSRKNRSSNN